MPTSPAWRRDWDSSTFPTTPGAYSSTGSGYFVKLNPAGNQRLYASCLNSSSNYFEGLAIAVVASGMVTIAGRVPGAGINIDWDAGVWVFDPSKSGRESLLLHESFGARPTDTAPSGLNDMAFSVAVDPTGRAWVTGKTFSGGLNPTVDAYKKDPQGRMDAFLVRIGDTFTKRLLVGNDGGVWSTADEGKTWLDHNTALAFAPSDASCLTYATGTADGQLLITSSGGGVQESKWIRLDQIGTKSPNLLPDRYITDLAFDPFDPGTLYVTFSGFDKPYAGSSTSVIPGHVFLGTKVLDPANRKWLDITPANTANRIDLPHNTIAVDPVDPNYLYVGTDLGVWKTTDRGNSWKHLGPSSGMPNVPVYDLQINTFTGRLIAFTYGRGAFKLTVPGDADLDITKTGTPDPVQAGGRITYTLTVTNYGPDPATNVTVRDLIPYGATLVSANTSQGTCLGTDTVVCKLGTLQVKASAIITVVVTAPATEGTTCNLATVSALEAERNTADNHVTECTKVVIAKPKPQADLSIQKSDSPDPVLTRNRLTYIITVKNNGPETASGVTITDMLPDGVLFESASISQGSCTGDALVECSLGNMAVGGTAVLTIRVRAPQKAGIICNIADVSSNEEDPFQADNINAECTEVIYPALADLTIVKEGYYYQDYPNSKDRRHDLIVKNKGPIAATQVRVSDWLPAGVTFRSASATQGTCRGSGPVICELGYLAVDAQATVYINFDIDSPLAGLLTNIARVTNLEVDPDPTNNVDTFQTRITPRAPRIQVMPPRLDFGKVDAGQSMDLPLTIANLGDEPLNVRSITTNNPLFTVVTTPTAFTVSRTPYTNSQRLITVRFSPTAAGSQNGLLNISSDDPARGVVTIPLTGGYCRLKKVAIVQNFADSEIGQLQSYLSQLSIPSQVFDQQGLTADALKDFALVIWDDLGEQANGLTDNDVAVFKACFDSGIPLYFLGDDLAYSARNLSASSAVQWAGLIHLQPAASSSGGNGTIGVVDGNHPVMHGPIGDIPAIDYSLDLDAAAESFEGETLLAQSGNDPALLAYQDLYTEVRSVTQNFLPVKGSSPAGVSAKKSLFQNAVVWLMKLDVTTGAQNRLQNPGAEVPYPDVGSSPTPAWLRGWTTTSTFTVERYDKESTLNNWDGYLPTLAESRAKNGGTHFFYGGTRYNGTEAAQSTATQLVSLSCEASEIDAGQRIAVLEGQLGG